MIYNNYVNIVKYIIYWAMLNLTIRIIVKGKYTPNKKLFIFSNGITSIISTYLYIYTANTDYIIAYYIYDLIPNLISLDIIYIIHHIATLYMITTPLTHPDHYKLEDALYLLKTGDLFIHINKIIGSSWLPYMKPKLATFIQNISLILSVILWVYLRVILTFKLYPFNTLHIYVIAIGFHIVNIFWCIKMVISIGRTQHKNHKKYMKYVKYKII
jgi:hypothetical protein